MGDIGPIRRVIEVIPESDPVLPEPVEPSPATETQPVDETELVRLR